MKIKSIMLMLALLFLPGLAAALESARVMVLPFQIYSPEDQTYLRTRLPEVISDLLSQEGAQMVPSDLSADTDWQRTVNESGGYRLYGSQRNADFLVWGSLTRIGRKISIDGRVLSTAPDARPTPVFAEGTGLENLAAIVQTLVQRISLRIFDIDQIVSIGVAGNQRIESDAILKAISTKPGDLFLPRTLTEDLRSVYQMGYFDDIQIGSEDTPQGKRITFIVTEKPTVRTIRILGNRIFEDDEILSSMNIRRGSILNMAALQSNTRRIASLYKEKNYHNVQVTYQILPLDNNQADVEFTIEEGGKVRIREIRFEGNRSIESDTLKGLMKTSEKGFWSWITSSGDLNREDLNQDATRLMAYYHNLGYVDARVGEPEISYEDDWIYITIKIEEGERYRIGKITIAGDLIHPESYLLNNLQISKETYYNREIIRKDVLRLSDIYSDAGYAYSDIAPNIDRQPADLIVNIRYEIRKGEKVYFDRINISGNTKTRDKVIRRQLMVHEGGIYSGRRLKQSIQNLQRLDYFEDIKVNTAKGDQNDEMTLDIEVVEKPTGTFSFGGGYSSTENLFAMGSISQRNLFGRGQILQFRAELGSVTQRFTLSFTEPWLFDIPLSAGFDLYKWDRDYDTYDKESTGGSVRMGYPVYDYTRAYLSYRYDISDIRDITDDASRDVKELEGENTTSSMTATLRYDSRDKAFNPTRGGNHSISVEYAGLGGDIGFTKIIAELGQYFPLFWDTVGYLHARGGYVSQNSGMILPDYEKFYMGGINSIRGFKWRDISLYDEDGAQIGGDQFIQFNVEYHIPLLKEAGLVGVIFYDTGNVFSDSDGIDLNDLRQSAGGGFRWYSPMGPIRIEYGYVLDRQEDEEQGRWEFAMGSTF